MQRKFWEGESKNSFFTYASVRGKKEEKKKGKGGGKNKISESILL